MTIDRYWRDRSKRSVLVGGEPTAPSREDWEDLEPLSTFVCAYSFRLLVKIQANIKMSQYQMLMGLTTNSIRVTSELCFSFVMNSIELIIFSTVY